MINTSQQPLKRSLRNALERAVKEARNIAEQAARQSLERLSVGETKPADYLDDNQRQLRTRLRALGRQLGDIKAENGEQSIDELVVGVAYEHWHRMLFARYLEQNNLLMYDQYTALTLDECAELVQEPDTARDELERRCTTGWELAGVLASKMLPQIFRIDSPVFELEFAPEHQLALAKLVTSLEKETFRASDSLGWVYQFWQSENKERINKSEVKIGARELPAVTQLFTEPYMVSFLLDNALGAWWTNQRLSEEDWQAAQSEDELRRKASIPGVPLTYLRFVQVEDEQGKLRWTPAAGTFPDWPTHLSELKTLDPSCGSGHFLVAALLMLVPMRMQLESLNEREAVDAVLRDNLHGLELDKRCVELAAFALALTAWTYPNSGGYRPLPEMHLACSGLSVNAAKDEWKKLGLGKKNMRIALDWMHDMFQDAPVLGSLLNPAKSNASKIVQWDELSSVLDQALQSEQVNDPDTANQHEATVVAQGLAKAAQLLAGQYQWVITNVPYRTANDLCETLREFLKEHYREGRNALETAFIQRCLEFLAPNGNLSVVTTQNGLFLTSYKHWRRKLLTENKWNLVARLGEKAFESSAAAGAFAAMLSLSRKPQIPQEGLFADNETATHLLRGLDVSEARSATEKAQQLPLVEVHSVEQTVQQENPDARIAFDEVQGDLLFIHANSYQGVSPADAPRFGRNFWEGTSAGQWVFWQSTVNNTVHYGGNELMLKLDDVQEKAKKEGTAYVRGTETWGKHGVVVSSMRSLPTVLYTGLPSDTNAAIVLPKHPELLPAIWCFCSSPDYNEFVRQIDQSLKVTNATLVKVPFNLDHWTAVAIEQYPHGLPLPYSNDPTQWIFHGHPAGSVVWDEEGKRTAHGALRADETVLQVAVARLLGYRWPSELDAEMELAPQQREWVERCGELSIHADDDGIVCLPAVRGERPADQRLEALLQTTYAEAWTVSLKNRLVESAGSTSIDHWLRDKFFEQHCKVFHNRPFVWHIWDGLKDGFSALLNYHKLNKSGLERLIYTYLGDWIRTQQAGIHNNEDGAQERLAAAEALKAELEAILQGEKPYDIFVRWKPLEEQPIGWQPDLNDGVRLNIRPFMLARDVARKGAGILRYKPNIKWGTDRGADVASAAWYHLGLEYGGKEGDRINDHHLSLEAKHKAKYSKAQA